MKMTYEENMSGWECALGAIGRRSLAGRQESRIESLNRLSCSGLPTFEHHHLSFDRFLSDEGNVRKLYGLYQDSVVIRACPTAAGLSRYTFIAKDYEQVKSELEKNILSRYRDKYTVILNEYDPAQYCGVIISSAEGLCIEMVAEPNLEGLCHGHVTPWSAQFSQRVPYRFSRMEYCNVGDESIRQVMWSVVKGLCEKKDTGGVVPLYRPRQGYFEFVISARTGCLRFVDYQPSA